MIYFVQAREVGLVKIGFAINVHRRMMALQLASPVRLDLLAEIPGDRARERALHERYAALRQHGEWFLASPYLLADVRELLRPAVEYEVQDGRRYPVLWRDSAAASTEICPFCGRRHLHGVGDGHRTAHCHVPGRAVADLAFRAADGWKYSASDGYIVRSRS